MWEARREGSYPSFNQGMDFSRAAALLWRRKMLLLFSMIVAIVLSYGATRLTGSRWVATVRFLQPITSPLTDENANRPDNQRLDAKAQAQMFSAIVKSPDVLERARKSVKTEMPFDIVDRMDFDANGQRLYELSVTDSNPRRAEEMVNAVADSFVKENHNLATKQAREVVDLIEDQRARARRELEAARKRYDDYCKANNVLGNPSGQLTMVLRRLEGAKISRDASVEMISKLQTRVQSRKALLERLPETIPLERNAGARPVVKQLEEALASNEIRLLQLRQKYEDKHPLIMNALRERENLTIALQTETAKPDIAKQPNPDRAAMPQNIRDMETEIASEQAAMTEANRNVALAEQELAKLRQVDNPLGALAQEVATASENLTALTSRHNSAMMQLDVASQLNPLVILERVGPANPPVNRTSGRTSKLSLLAALCAFVLTSFLVILLDGGDKRLKTVQEAELLLATQVLAVVPPPTGAVTSRMLPRITEREPLSAHAESFRFLAQHILTSRHRSVRTLMPIATRGGQGSSNTIANLAITLAQSGHKVLLVDANLRNPTLHTIFEVENEIGLADLLETPTDEAIAKAIQPTTIQNLFVLPGGSASENPWRLFTSANLGQVTRRLKQQADYLLFDTPAALEYAETLNLASVVDAALLCIRAQDPLSGKESRLIDLCEQQGVLVLGCVLNDVPPPLQSSYLNMPRITQPTMAAEGVLEEAPASSLPVPRYPAVTMRSNGGGGGFTPPAVPMTAQPVSNRSEEFCYMTEAAATLLPEFPRASNGYAPSSVQDYVHHSQVRMEELQKRLDSQVATNSQQAHETTRMASELEAAKRRLSDLESRASEASHWTTEREQWRVQMEQEREQMRQAALDEAARIRAQAQQEAAALREKSFRDVEEVRALGDTYLEQANRSRAQAQSEADAVRKEAYTNALMLIQQTQADAQAEAERIREQARREAEAMLAEARHKAEKADERTAAIYHVHEEHMRTLGAEASEIVNRFRTTLEKQLAQMPPPVFVAPGADALNNGNGNGAADAPKKPAPMPAQNWQIKDWTNAS